MTREEFEKLVSRDVAILNLDAAITTQAQHISSLRRELRHLELAADLAQLNVHRAEQSIEKEEDVLAALKRRREGMG